MELVHIDVMIDANCLLSADRAEESLGYTAEHTYCGGVHFREKEVFTAYVGWRVWLKENQIGGVIGCQLV